MGLKLTKKFYSTYSINKLYPFNSSSASRNYLNSLYSNFNPLSTNMGCLLLYYNTGLVTFFSQGETTLNIIFRLFHDSFLKFFPTQVKKPQKSRKNLFHLSLLKTPKKAFKRVKKHHSYSCHTNFMAYKPLFKQNYLNLFSPLVKIKNSRKFPFFKKNLFNKTLKVSKRQLRVKFVKRHWFLTFLSHPARKVKVLGWLKSPSDNYRRFLRLDKSWSKAQRSAKRKKRVYLTPKQHLFLNSYSTRINYKKNKPLKTLLLRRVRRFYKKRPYKISYNKISSRMTRSIFKYKIRRVLKTRRRRKINFARLTVTNSNNFYKFHSHPHKGLNRKKTSRRKLTFKKRQLLSMLRYYRLTTSSKRLRTTSRYLKKMRIRYFAWRVRKLIKKGHKTVRFNRFSRINSRLIQRTDLSELWTPYLTRTFIKQQLLLRHKQRFYLRKSFNLVALKKFMQKNSRGRRRPKSRGKGKFKGRGRILTKKKRARSLSSFVIFTPYDPKRLTRLRKQIRVVFPKRFTNSNLISALSKEFLVPKVRRRLKNELYRPRSLPYIRKFVRKIWKLRKSRTRYLNSKVKPLQKRTKYFFKAIPKGSKRSAVRFLKWRRYNYRLLLLLARRTKKNTLMRSPLAIFKQLLSKRSMGSNLVKSAKLNDHLITNIKPSKNAKSIFSSWTSSLSVFKKTTLSKPLIVKLGLGLKKKKIRRFSLTSNWPRITKPNPQSVRKFHVSTKLAVLSKHRTSFILSSIGFIFIQNIRKGINSLLKAKLNRYRYSFFYLNDIKRLFLRRPNHFKLLTTSLFSTRRKKSYPVDINRFSSTFDSSYDENLKSRSASLSTTTKLHHFTFKNKFLYNNPFGSYAKREVRIKRIKFKPGYSRIWRNARKALNKVLGFNLRYQYRLTREVARLSRIKSNSHVFLKELTLINLLISSHFVSDLTLSKLLVESNVVFVNGLLASNPNFNLFSGDFIELIVSLKYYIVYRWMLNWNRYKKIRLSKLSKVKFKKKSSLKGKQRSSNLPDWVLTSRVKSLDVPKYLEVDFFTLSSFILYEPFLMSDFNPSNLVDSRTEILNMYNWKYIN